MAINRRDFVWQGLGSVSLALAFEIGGGVSLLTPQQARAQSVPLRSLTAAEATGLERLADAILPGASAAGFSHFIDHQLGVDPNDCLLIAKYFQVPPPYSNFYRAGVMECEELSRRSSSQGLRDLTDEALRNLIMEISKPGTRTAAGFELSLFYMCLRSDALDVVYGTPAGFEKLNVPYMAHIMPPEGWNG